MSPAAAATVGRREWTGLAVLALACLLYAMDLTVLHLAVLRRVRPAYVIGAGLAFAAVGLAVLTRPGCSPARAQPGPYKGDAGVVE